VRSPRARPYVGRVEIEDGTLRDVERAFVASDMVLVVAAMRSPKRPWIRGVLRQPVWWLEWSSVRGTAAEVHARAHEEVAGMPEEPTRMQNRDGYLISASAKQEK